MIKTLRADDLDTGDIRRWRRDVFRLLSQIDPRRWKPSERSFSTATILAGIMAVGTDPLTLSRLTGFSESFIKHVLKRARKAPQFTKR